MFSARAVDALHVLQQADRPSRPAAPAGGRAPSAIAAILPRTSRADVALDEVVDLVEPRERRRPAASARFDGRVDEQLLRELDDRAVRAADVLARAALRAQARDDLDDEVDLVRAAADRGR